MPTSIDRADFPPARAVHRGGLAPRSTAATSRTAMVAPPAAVDRTGPDRSSMLLVPAAARPSSPRRAAASMPSADSRPASTTTRTTGSPAPQLATLRTPLARASDSAMRSRTEPMASRDSASDAADSQIR